MFNRIESETRNLTPACNVERFCYRYPASNRLALNGIDFQTKQGDIVAVFGESGSGKSTLFASISGLIPHYYRGGEFTGKIFLFGKDTSQAELSDLTPFYGVVTQNFRDQLLSNTVEGAIAFPMENQNTPDDIMHERVEALLKLMQLTKIRKKDVDQLSGGQGQRAAIASMLAKNPNMMIFDDIASDLDPRGQNDVQQIIARLKENGITILVTDSSDPNGLIRFADKALVLGEGEIIYQGNPKALVNSQHLAVKTGILTPGVEFRSGRNSPDAVVVEGVSFAYNGEVAVDRVTCQITQNSITGIIGHNGSGKTTLLKIIGGLYKPRDGQVLIYQKQPIKLQPSKRVREVAYLPQNTKSVFFTDSVISELAYTPTEIGIPLSVSPETLGLEGLEGTYPEFLSGGEKQRLAIGCALSSDPRVILFDEPTKGLNQKERLDLARHMLDLQQQGKTVIIVSHDLQLIGRVTENLLVMDHGRLVNQGATKDILQDKDFFNDLGMPLPW